MIWDGEFFPSAHINERGRRAASALRDLGVSEGGAVALLLRNEPVFFEAWSAAASTGAVVVPLNWHLRPDEIAHILDDCRAEVLVADTALLSSLEGVRVGRTVVTSGGEWEALVQQYAPIPTAVTPSAPALLYSSGTTGRPKGIRRLPRSAEAAAIYARVSQAVYGIEPGMCTVVAAPLYHSAPLYHATSAFTAGGTLVLQSRFDAAELLALIERYRVTNLLVVPTMLRRLLQLPAHERERHDLSSLRHVIMGAAPAPHDLKVEVIEWLGPILYEYYGATETGIVAACDSAEAIAHRGTVGRPVEGATVRIMDDSGLELPPGSVGNVYARNRGSADFVYENLPEERAAVERGGLIGCGDVGYVDADGYLYLLDRRNDMVISGGVNIYPAEVEAQLAAMRGVADSAVFGIPDDDYGEALAAVVVPLPGSRLTEAGVLAFLRRRLGGMKVPKSVEIRDRLPRDPNGKLMKRQLRAEYAEEADRSVQIPGA
ncbi:MAG: AMP-binding protein [Candidatus Dormibacteria bacterium]